MPALPRYLLLDDNPGVREVIEAFGQNRWRDHAQAPLQFVELGATHQKLADNQQGPFLAKYLGGLGNGAELGNG